VAVAQVGQERLDRAKIVTLALSQAERHGSPTSLNDRVKLRIDSTLSTTYCLGSLAAARICTVLMQFDVRAINMPQLTCGSPIPWTAAAFGRIWFWGRIGLFSRLPLGDTPANYQKRRLLGADGSWARITNLHYSM